MKRGLITFVFGLIFGTAVGLYFGWFVFPVQWVDVVPSDLTAEDQQDYLSLIAATYAAEENLVAAQQRLAGLGREDWRPWLLTHTVDAVLSDPLSIQTTQLVHLAQDLGLESPAFTPYQTTTEPEPVTEQDG